MATSPSERQYILRQVNTLAVRDLTTLWRQAERLSTTEFAEFVIEAFPDLVDPFAAMAGEIAAEWYDESDLDSGYIATPSGMPNTTALSESATWALGATGDVALTRLSGTLQRAVFNAARDTIVDNVANEPGSRWARHASANACEFCKMLATRSSGYGGADPVFYNSQQAAGRVVGRGKEMSASDRRIRAAGGNRGARGRIVAGGIKSRGSRKLGDKYHDHCRCLAVEIRPGKSYEPAPYVEKWNEDYVAARKAAGSGDPKKILAAWRQLQTS